jgi:hypothetical protein
MRTLIRTIFPWLIVLSACGCIDRTRLNAKCEWTGDSAFRLDLANPEHLLSAQRFQRIDSRRRPRPGMSRCREVSRSSHISYAV